MTANLLPENPSDLNALPVSGTIRFAAEWLRRHEEFETAIRLVEDDDDLADKLTAKWAEDAEWRLDLLAKIPCDSVEEVVAKLVVAASWCGADGSTEGHEHRLYKSARRDLEKLQAANVLTEVSASAVFGRLFKLRLPA